MTLTTRTIFILMLVLALAGELIAQEAPTGASCRNRIIKAPIVSAMPQSSRMSSFAIVMSG